MPDAAVGSGQVDPATALRAAVMSGAPSDLAAWAATGSAGLGVLRTVLIDRSDLGAFDMHPKDAIDGLSAAVAAIASAHPAAFLEEFADPGLVTNSFVILGLGYVDDPRATARLVEAARRDDRWPLRVDAAIGLARHSSPTAVQALVELLSDSEYLVRYHALRGLAAVGDASAVKDLRAFNGQTKIERDLAASALRAIADRGGRAPEKLHAAPIT